MLTRRTMLHTAAMSTLTGLAASRVYAQDGCVIGKPACISPTRDLSGRNAPPLRGTPVRLESGIGGGWRCCPTGAGWACADISAFLEVEYTRYDDIDVYGKLISVTQDPYQHMFVASKVWGDNVSRPWDRLVPLTLGYRPMDYWKSHVTSGNPQTLFRFDGAWNDPRDNDRMFPDSALIWELDRYDNGFLISFGGGRSRSRCNERVAAYALVPRAPLSANVRAVKTTEEKVSIRF